MAESAPFPGQVVEVPASRLPDAQAAFHRPDPEPAVRLLEDGVHRACGEGTRMLSVVPEVVDKELLGNECQQPRGLRSQEDLVAVDLDAVDDLAADPLEIVGDRVEQVHAVQRDGDGLPVARPREAGDEILREGTRIPGVVRVPFPFSGPAVDEIQAVLRRDPDALAGGQEIGEVGLFPELEAREDRVGLQTAGRVRADLVEPALERCPDGAVPIDIFEDEIGGRKPFVDEIEHFPDGALVIEGDADQRRSGLEPQVAGRIQRQERAKLVLERVEGGVRQVQQVQGPEVQEVQSAIRGDPEPVETVFADIADEIAPEGDGGGGAEREEVVPVEPAQAAARGGQPQEAGVVQADVVDEIAGEAVLHGEGALQVAVLEPVLGQGRKARRSEKERDCQPTGFYTSKVHLSTF